MSEINGIAKEIVKTIREDKNKGTKPYDTQATVMRVEDGTAWVRIPGGVDETPAQLTMDAKEGDNVQVRVSGGRAWLAGNGTSPPTDDTKAVEANENAKSASIAARAAFNAAGEAQMDAARAHDAADKAEASASEAKTSASAANSYAIGALNSLSTTQDIIGVLNWVEESIKYVWDYPPTVEGKEYDPSKQYYTVIGKRVINPVETDYDKYYVLNSESEPTSKTGNIVTFDSDLDNFPLKSLKVSIEPKQAGSGDPSPDNVRPISGWDSVEATLAGDNLVDDTLRNYTNTVTLPAGTWYAQAFIYAASEINTRLDYINENGNWASVLSSPFETSTFTTEGNYTFGWAYPAGANPKTMTLNVTKPTTFRFNTASLNNTRRLSLSRVRKTSISDFVEYQGGETKVSTLPETVYGGSLDVVNGVLTVDRAMVDLGTLSWVYDSAVPRFYSSGIASVAKGAPASNKKANIICSAYRILALDGSEDSIYGSEGNGGIALSAGGNISVKDTSYTTATAFKTAMSGVQLVYELAEPRTIQLTPKQVTTLLGTNNVWADSGDVTVEYWDGPVGYVTPTSSFDPTETYYTVKGSPVKIDESKQEEHGKGLYYVHDLTNAKEAMADFIKARLALTDKGLYVVGGDTENEGYKILLASDGMTVYDAQGVAVSKFGENIEFSSTRAQYIGGETAYIVFNPEDGTINAGGEGFRFNNNMTLSDMLAEVGKIGGEDGLEQSTEDLLQKTKSISYENGKLIISGGENSNMKLVMESDRIGFYDGDNEVAYISNNQMCIPRSIVLDSLDMGDNKWRWTLNTDDHLTLQWIGG